MIEPGVIRTNFEATAVSNLDSMKDTPYAGALAKYEEMSKMADKFASNPIVIAKAIGRAVRARRASARYVAPFSTNFVLLLSAILPRFVWDWAMRKVGYLSMKNLDTRTVSGTIEAKPPTKTPPTGHTAAAN